MSGGEVRIGSRASPLAQAQSRLVAGMLEERGALGPGGCEVVAFRTRGDGIRDRPLAEAGGKGLFTRELDEALLAGGIRFAVHSMKDLPVDLVDGVVVAAVPVRGDPGDVLVGADGPLPSLADLPQGASVGTSSLRRAAQIRLRRGDVEVRPLRGNVDTRLRRIQEGRADATVLAAAGLVRLGASSLVRRPLPHDEMLPAPAQGALALTCRADDGEARAFLAAVEDPRARTETDAERAFLAALGGDCTTPAAALARADGNGRVTFEARLADPEGGDVFETRAEGAAGEAGALGREAGAKFRRDAAALLARLRKT